MKNLKQLRKSANMTLQNLADELGTSTQVLSRYERGEHQADYNTLMRIARFFNVSIDYLLDFKAATAPQTVALPLDEMELLKNYRALSYVGKARVAAYTDLLREQEEGSAHNTRKKA